MRDGGCYGHVDGPRFNTRAEIRGLAACGVTAVSQTAGPETVLCGEAELPYALLGFLTDYANGVKRRGDPGRDADRDDGRLHRGVRRGVARRAPRAAAPGAARAGRTASASAEREPSRGSTAQRRDTRTVVSAWPEMRKSSSRNASPRARPRRRLTPSKRSVARTCVGELAERGRARIAALVALLVLAEDDRREGVRRPGRRPGRRGARVWRAAAARRAGSAACRCG